MIRISTLPTLSDWLDRLKYFHKHQDECMQGLLHCKFDLLDAFDIVCDTIINSIPVVRSGVRYYSVVLHCGSDYAHTLSTLISLEMFIDFMLEIDDKFYDLDIVNRQDDYSIVLSLKTAI